MNADLADKKTAGLDRITGWTGLTGLRGFGGWTKSCHPAAEKIRVNPVRPILWNHSMPNRRLATLLRTDGAANPQFVRGPQPGNVAFNLLGPVNLQDLVL